MKNFSDFNNSKRIEEVYEENWKEQNLEIQLMLFEAHQLIEEPECLQIELMNLEKKYNSINRSNFIQFLKNWVEYLKKMSEDKSLLKFSCILRETKEKLGEETSFEIVVLNFRKESFEKVFFLMFEGQITHHKGCWNFEQRLQQIFFNQITIASSYSCNKIRMSIPILKGNISLSKQSSTVLNVGLENQITREFCLNSNSLNFDSASQENECLSNFEDISKFLSLDGIENSESSFGGLIMASTLISCLEDKNSRNDMLHIENLPLQKKHSRNVTLFSETKNIPKNFGKQIIKFVKQNGDLIQNILFKIGSTNNYQSLNEELQNRKKKMNRIQNLRSLWMVNSSIGKEMRVISSFFLKKYCFNWIFGSRIKHFNSHLKYKTILQDVLMNPDKFVYLKREC